MCAELRHCQRWVTNRERQRVPQWRSRDGKTSLSVGRRIHGSWLHSAYVHGLIRPRSRCMICTTEDCESPTGLSQWIVCVCVCVVRFLGWVSATLSSVCAHFGLPLPCLRSVLSAACFFCSRLLSNVSSPPFIQSSFYSLLAWIIRYKNLQYKTAPKRQVFNYCNYELDQFLNTKVSQGNVATPL